MLLNQKGIKRFMIIYNSILLCSHLLRRLALPSSCPLLLQWQHIETHLELISSSLGYSADDGRTGVHSLNNY